MLSWVRLGSLVERSAQCQPGTNTGRLLVDDERCNFCMSSMVRREDGRNPAKSPLDENIT